MQYIPTIYGFKIFGQKGSRYELVYDNLGQAKNQKEIDTILKKKQSTSAGAPGGILGGISGATMGTSSSTMAAGQSSLGGDGSKPRL